MQAEDEVDTRYSATALWNNKVRKRDVTSKVQLLETHANNCSAVVLPDASAHSDDPNDLPEELLEKAESLDST